MDCHGLRPRNDVSVAAVFPNTRGRLSEQAFIQVEPVGVGGFDEGDFAISVARLELFFAGDGELHGGVLFKPDQDMHMVFAGEAFDQVVFVLPYALDQVTGHAHIQRAVASTGQQVHAGLLQEASQGGLSCCEILPRDKAFGKRCAVDGLPRPTASQ